MAGEARVVSATSGRDADASEGDALPMGDIIMMSGRPYVRRPVAWHGAYFAEELVPLEEAKG